MGMRERELNLIRFIPHDLFHESCEINVCLKCQETSKKVSLWPLTDQHQNISFHVGIYSTLPDTWNNIFDAVSGEEIKGFMFQRPRLLEENVEVLEPKSRGIRAQVENSWRSPSKMLSTNLKNG